MRRMIDDLDSSTDVLAMISPYDRRNRAWE